MLRADHRAETVGITVASWLALLAIQVTPVTVVIVVVADTIDLVTGAHGVTLSFWDTGLVLTDVSRWTIIVDTALWLTASINLANAAHHVSNSLAIIAGAALWVNTLVVDTLAAAHGIAVVACPASGLALSRVD